MVSINSIPANAPETQLLQRLPVPAKPSDENKTPLKGLKVRAAPPGDSTLVEAGLPSDDKGAAKEEALNKLRKETSEEVLADSRWKRLAQQNAPGLYDLGEIARKIGQPDEDLGGLKERIGDFIDDIQKVQNGALTLPLASSVNDKIQGILESDEYKEYLFEPLFKQELAADAAKANTGLTNAYNALKDLSDESFNAAGSDPTELAVNLFKEMGEAQRKMRTYGTFMSAGATDSKALDEKIIGLAEDKGFSKDQTQSFRNYVWDRALSSAFTGRNPADVMENFDKEFQAVAENVGSFIDDSKGLVSDRVEAKKVNEALGMANFVMVATSVGAIATQLSARGLGSGLNDLGIGAYNGMIVAANGLRDGSLGGLSSVEQNPEKVRAALADELREVTGDETANDQDIIRAYRRQLEGTSTGSGFVKIHDKILDFQKSMVELDVRKHGPLFAQNELGVNFYSAHPESSKVLSEARDRLVPIESMTDMTYYLDFTKQGGSSNGDIDVFRVMPILSDTSGSDWDAELDEFDEYSAYIAKLARESWEDEPSYPGGGSGSDRRIKQDIVLLGRHERLDVNIYAWRYRNDDPTRYVGVMAQELLERHDLKFAVSFAQHGEFAGYLQVHYDRLGLQMMTEEDFVRNSWELSLADTAALAA